MKQAKCLKKKKQINFIFVTNLLMEKHYRLISINIY